MTDVEIKLGGITTFTPKTEAGREWLDMQPDLCPNCRSRLVADGYDTCSTCRRDDRERA